MTNPRDGFLQPDRPTACTGAARAPSPAPRLGEHTDATAEMATAVNPPVDSPPQTELPFERLTGAAT